MTYGEFRITLERVKDQATNERSITNPNHYTKKQVWHRLERQLWVKANEEGLPASGEIINELYVKILNKEFNL